MMDASRRMQSDIHTQQNVHAHRMTRRRITEDTPLLFTVIVEKWHRKGICQLS